MNPTVIPHHLKSLNLADNHIKLSDLDDVLKTRPLLFVSTIHQDIVNLAVYASYLTTDFGNYILLESQLYKNDTSAGTKTKAEIKDTLNNVKSTGYAVLNIPLNNSLNQIYNLASSLPYSQSEAQTYNIKTEDYLLGDTSLPYIKNSIVSIFCSCQGELLIPGLDDACYLILKPQDAIYNPALFPYPYDPIRLKSYIGENAIFHYGNSYTKNKLMGNIQFYQYDYRQNVCQNYGSQSDWFPQISNLIDQTISQLSTKFHQQPLSGVSQSYIESYYQKLKKDLLSEISILIDVPSQYFSLKDVFGSNNVTDTSIGSYGCSTYVFSQHLSKNFKSTINIIFPMRNSAKLLDKSLFFLLEEIRKASNIFFNLVIVINDTKDPTIKITKEILEEYPFHLINVSTHIIESLSNEKPSLPGALNIGYWYITDLLKGQRSLCRYNYFSFWDDEVTDQLDNSTSIFKSNLFLLEKHVSNKIISGYMIDNRELVSRWHTLSKGFSADIRFAHSRPYIHGGAGCLLRLEDYPTVGLPHDGIADTDLCSHVLLSLGEGALSILTHQNWPVRLNPKAFVYHPSENNILFWTIKYIMYGLAWQKTFDRINQNNPKISELWCLRKKESRCLFHTKIDNYINNLSVTKLLDREFMHQYYQVIDCLNNKENLYCQLKQYRPRSYDF